MNVQGKHYRTIWFKDYGVIQAIDQTKLPHEFCIEDMHTIDDVIAAINTMHVRGAGLLGAAAGYGMYLAAFEAPEGNFSSHMEEAGKRLLATRPTAVNIRMAVEGQLNAIRDVDEQKEGIEKLLKKANAIADEDAEFCWRIGEHGLRLIEEISKRKGGEPVNILTHCNAGWLAFVDYGTATAPIYAAHNKGIAVHVWVDETRPVNQGSRLTAWELGHQGVPHTVVADNTGGHLMQKGLVDIVLVGSDRVTRRGDAANKIGTYLKALAAKDNNIPFYVAIPSTSIDWRMMDGGAIQIEQRSGDEVKYITGLADGKITRMLLTPENSEAANYAFDVTPGRLITGIITDRGICKADFVNLMQLYPETIPKGG